MTGPDPASPPPSPPPPSPAGRRSSGGCLLRGCVVGCLAPIVLGAVVAVLALTVGGPLVAERVAEARRGNPALDTSLRMLDAWRASAPKEEPGESAEGAGDGKGPAKRLPGSGDPARLPADLPLHPRGADRLVSAGPEAAAVFERVAAPRAEVARFYAAAMREQGWAPGRHTAGEGSELQLWEKGKRICRLELVDADGGTEIWIRSAP
jgi:hypothetical protein